MIIGIDIETWGLDARKFLCGCIVKDNAEKAEVFLKKEDLWNRVLELMQKQQDRKKSLCIYSHNAAYDTAGYINLLDKNLKFFSHRPFIWAYTDEHKKEICKFLDTMSIYPMSLEAVGELIGHEKMNMPEGLLEEEQSLSKKELETIIEYMVNDTRILITAIKKIKDKLSEDGINIRRLYTLNQIANNAMLFELRKLPTEQTEHLFWYAPSNQAHRTLRELHIHEAYRAGRVEAFQTGHFSDVTAIDVNSLYPLAAMNMTCPDLRTERLWTNVNGVLMMNSYKHANSMTIKELLKSNYLFIAKCLIFNKNDDFGCLAVRTPSGNFYLKKGQYGVGTWTHIELQDALDNGHELINVEWVVTWQPAFNPFSIIMKNWHDKRILSNEKFDNWFYKNMMNRGIGKLAQYRMNQEFIIDNVERCEEYLEKNYEVVKGVDTNYLYKYAPSKDMSAKWEDKDSKPYYMPAVPMFINAWARVYMHKYYRLVPKQDLIYTDTDSIIFLGDHLDKFPLDENIIGSFKILHEKTNAVFYSRKAYALGEEMKLAGVFKGSLNKEDFYKGVAKDRKMITLGTTKELSKIGSFVTENRDLLKQNEMHLKVYDLLNSQTVLIDDKSTTGAYFFLDDLKKIN